MEDSGIDSGDRVANFMVRTCENSQTYAKVESENVITSDGVDGVADSELLKLNYRC